MIKHPENKETEEVLNTIIEALHEIKGVDVISINLNKLIDPVCEYFVICHADSGVQVRALADNVLLKVKETTGDYVWNKEGYDNAQWILLDYANIVVHIFEEEYRSFYNLEGLWADAEVVKHNDE